MNSEIENYYIIKVRKLENKNIELRKERYKLHEIDKTHRLLTLIILLVAVKFMLLFMNL